MCIYLLLVSGCIIYSGQVINYFILSSFILFCGLLSLITILILFSFSATPPLWMVRNLLLHDLFDILRLFIKLNDCVSFFSLHVRWCEQVRVCSITLNHVSLHWLISVVLMLLTNVCSVSDFSSALQLYINSGSINGRYCDFAVEQIACASVRHQNTSRQHLSPKLKLHNSFRLVFAVFSHRSFVTQLSLITAQDLAGILMCNRSSNSSGSRAAWSLVLSKTSSVLDQALDLLSPQVEIIYKPSSLA